MLAAALLALVTPKASAQLDPLLFLKRCTPNIIFDVDVRNTMLQDADGTYYDPNQYTWSNSGSDLAWQTALGLVQGVNIANQNNAPYYRKFVNRTYTAAVNQGGGVTSDFAADSITAVGNLASGYSTFYEKTRFMVTRRALTQAIDENSNVARFGLLKMRQTAPTWGTAPNNKLANDAAKISATTVAGALQQAADDTARHNGVWYYMKTTVTGNNGAAAASTANVVLSDSSTANADVRTKLDPATGLKVTGGLIPAANTTVTQTDAPVGLMLDDAKTEATRLIGADTSCRNTVIVLIVAGGEGTTVAAATAATTAAKGTNFLNVSGRRVPVYVIAVAPPAADVANLQLIATNSGGKFVQITKANIDAVAAGTAVPEFVKAVNVAVQDAFERYEEFNTAPTASLPYGPESEFQVTSPIIGTVNLAGALDIDGVSLSNTTVVDKEGNTIPQRTNVMVTSGFSVPGFEGRLRGFRMYKPVADATKTSGYKFSQDGTRLWVGCAPGTTSSGPCSSLATSARNIYTSLPDGTVVSFTSDQASTLAPYLSGATAAPAGFDAAGLINTIRAMPLGAIVSSTPAIMDPPSLDPPPDADYPAFVTANKDRRSIIWICANDGMLHAIDARLGVEVWAFIPFNLLPKLHVLLDGQPVGKFDYLMDGSPKIADVKIDGAWKTYLIVGEGPGGTFYQTFDVTLPGMSATASPTDNTIGPSLTYFSDSSKVPLQWSFPRTTKFDHTIHLTVPTVTAQGNTTSSAPSSGDVWGDISSTATTAEKSVGQSWSDPAVGQVLNSSGKFTVIVGSGFLPYFQQHAANRGDVIAGTTLYMLDAKTGLVDASKDIGSDGVAETVDDCASVSVNNCQVLKNALQADPVATGPPDSRFINKAYIGDLDGRIWRYNITADVSGNPAFSGEPINLFNASLVGGHGSPKKAGAAQPVFSSMASVTVGGTQQYIFFGTGSDLLSSNGVNQAYQLIGFLDDGTTGIQSFAYSLTAVANSTTNEEKVTAFPAVAGDIVFFTTTTFKPATPCILPDANLYALTYIGGAAYDTTGDDTIKNDDSVKVKTVAGARATAPFVVDQHLVFATGTKVEMFGDANDYNNGVGQVGVRMLSWREVR
jgi:hypothetical protein